MEKISFYQLCKYRNQFFVKPAFYQAIKIAFKFSVKKPFKEIFTAFITALFYAIFDSDFNKLNNLKMIVVEIIVVGFCVWLSLSAIVFIGRFVSNLFKLQVISNQKNLRSKLINEIVEIISELQLEAENLTLDKIDGWEEKAENLLKSIPDNENGIYLLSFRGEIISNSIITHYLDWLRCKNAGRLERVTFPFKLKPNPMENIEFKAFGCLGYVKAVLLPYTIPSAGRHL